MEVVKGTNVRRWARHVSRYFFFSTLYVYICWRPCLAAQPAQVEVSESEILIAVMVLLPSLNRPGIIRSTLLSLHCKDRDTII